MNILRNYVYVWKSTFNYDTRASRSEFWYFVLVNLIIELILLAIGNNVATAMNTILFVTNLIMFFPTLSVSIRRLHDTNRSALWYFIYFVPVGNFLLFYFFTRPSDIGRNNYGLLENDGYYY